MGLSCVRRSSPRPPRCKVPDPSKADSISKIEPRRNLAREAWLAAAAGTRWIPPPYREAGTSSDEYARALEFLPLAGLIAGVALALVDRALAPLSSAPARSAITIAVAVLLSGGIFPIGVARTVDTLIAGTPADDNARRTRWLGALAALLMIAMEVFALGAIAGAPARARALVLAMLLSRWAIVPIGYGLRPLEESGLGIPYFGGLTFAEFAISSVIALGIAMGLYDVIGLAAIVAVALAILGLRLLLSRRLVGVGGNALAAGAAVCELLTLAVLAALSGI
jgi:cobalamin synthase